MAVETPEFLSMLKRMIRAAGKRVGDADEPELATLIALQHELDDAIRAAVEGQRAIGRSWADIARGTGTTRQGAFKRWGKESK